LQDVARATGSKLPKVLKFRGYDDMKGANAEYEEYLEKEKGKGQNVGRPTSYRPKYCSDVIRFGANGYTIAMMAAGLGVWEEAMMDWVGKFSHFSRAFRVAKDLQKRFWDTWGMQNMNSRTFNSRLFELYRANMHGWGQKVELSGQLEHKISLSGLHELAERKQVQGEVLDVGE
jgi:hypothetical protein